MYIKCLILLLFCKFIHAQYHYHIPDRCSRPYLPNGFARLKQRLSLVKFSCRARYTLVGNKYATCRNGQWDVPVPVCVKSGCLPLPQVKNSVVQSYHDAWMLYFCLPGYRLEGSPVIYCDGRHWNDTAPKCVDASAPPPTTCDFEDADLCGWRQDELHDFDWRRLNKKTPSSFLLTGPQYDHTYGKDGNGYYMYIESTSRLENDTARLISPVFDKNLVKNSCFVFYYHMFGKTIGGLRVYQKPDKINLYDALNTNVNGTSKYLLFEQWGNQGNVWYTSVTPLLDVGDDFQIVIEGIRGKSFLSDIAIDDVGIYHGENCTTFKNEGVTPELPPEETCQGRCGKDNHGLDNGCDCTMMCVVTNSCCPDYLEVCEFSGNYDGTETTIEDSSTVQLPQTQKLVATTTSTIQISSTTTTTPLTTTSTTKSTTRRPTTTSTRRTTPTTTKPSTTTQRSTTKSQTTKATTIVKLNSTILTTTKSPLPVTFKTRATKATNTYLSSTVKSLIAPKQIVPEKSGGTSALTTWLVVLCSLSLCAGAALAWRVWRGAGGALLCARARAAASRDPEVRFLKADDQLDDD